MRHLLPFCILNLAFSTSFAQTDSNLVHVNGRVYDPATPKPDLNNFMIVDMETQHGFYGKADGSFSIDINKNDTLVIAVIGYDFVKYCFRDSIPKERYDLLVRLKRKEIQLPEVRVIARVILKPSSVIFRNLDTTNVIMRSAG